MQKDIEASDIQFGSILEPDEIEFAKGTTLDTQNIRITYKYLNSSEPTEKFPTIYKTWGNGEVDNLGFTPQEGRFIAKMINEMYK